jgi:hypothetical protein
MKASEREWNFKPESSLFARILSFLVSAVLLLVSALRSRLKRNMLEAGRVQGPPWLLGTTAFNLKSVGYEQSEYFVQGTARSYASAGPLTADGKWTVEPAEEAGFKTRIVVYRPTDPARFNGTVLIEWFNVSGGTEASSEWIMSHTELIREGYAWVGVSAQRSGIDGAGVTVGHISLPLKKIDPWRYGTLVHPGDRFSYDIFRQAAKAVLEPQGVAPLGDLKVERAIAAGESQSADHLLTYVNAIAPRERLFHAYLIHSRLHGSASLSPDPEATTVDLVGRDPVRVREDLDVPVLMLQTETDTEQLGTHLDRQPDSEWFRLWEVAGTAHADYYVGRVGMMDRGDNPQIARVVETRHAIPGFLKCSQPINCGPQHFVANAAIAALDKWLRTGEAPRSADRFAFDETTSELVRDRFGIVVGGIRTPYVDVPIATLSGGGQLRDTIIEHLFGTTKLFNAATLAELYPDHETYVAAVRDSVASAVEKGFLRRVDAALIVGCAEASNIGARRARTATLETKLTGDKGRGA